MNLVKLLPLTFLLLLVIITSCDEPLAPKPRGYFRITLPKKSYTSYQPNGCPFHFDIPTYATVVQDSADAAKCWMNIEFPDFKGTLYLSYKDVNNDLPQLIDDCRSLAMKHTAKASAIDESQFVNSENDVYGLNYKLKGSSASPMQFWLTDSTRHFVRASLYFYAVPNPDSIAPVQAFIEDDLRQLIESFRWN